MATSTLVCPKETCVHHDPLLALGDAIRTKNHHCWKHGVKNMQVYENTIRYMLSSLIGNIKMICGTHEYKCECDTIFPQLLNFQFHIY